MARYELTNKAVEDLSEIWEYTFEVWSERQADKYYELLISSFQEIANNPQLGRSYQEVANTLFGLKSGRHIIFYRSIDNGQVEIIRILHEKMDLRRRLSE